MKAISDDEYARGLKILAQEQLIPSDQFDKLMTMVDILNMGKLIEVVVNENSSRSSVSPTKKGRFTSKVGRVGKNVS